MRSKKVMTILGIQGFAQLVRDYGKEEADVIKENMGNQTYGMTNNGKDAEEIAKLPGKYYRKMTSHSYGEERVNPSINEQLTDKLTGSEISGQKVGHFFVKVANGDPAFNYAQFGDGRIHKLLNIEEEEVKPIPNFFNPIDTTDKELLYTVASEILQQNFDKVRNDIYELIDEYTSKDELANL